MKTVKTPIFMFCFLVIGLMFWPIEICYGHVNEGSRTSAVLGLLAVVNVAVLRAIVTILADESFGQCHDGCLLSLGRAFFHSALHVTALLRKVDELESDEPDEESQGRFTKIKS
ncbi:hypothetical protein HDU79_001512, partial [Rhizoclosmatium sp. JEL0117]